MHHFRRLSQHFPRDSYEDNEKQDKRVGHGPFQETILAYTWENYEDSEKQQRRVGHGQFQETIPAFS
jgi:hypothetical protein